MKKIILTILLVSVFTCKNEKKETDNTIEQNEPTKKEVLTNVKIAPFPGWGKIGIDITETEEVFSEQKVFIISRSNEDSKSSYAHTQKIDVDYSYVYRASVIAKKGELGNLFGLRIAGVYPERVDAVFNLEEGTIKGVQKTRDFENETTNIKNLGNGWYECSVTAEIAADQVAIYLGPTKGKEYANAWTVRTDDKCNAYVIPSSLKFEKVSIE